MDCVPSKQQLDQNEQTVLEFETAGIMKEFFHGWRRKVGCATLALALILLGGWLRTLVFADVSYAGWEGKRLIAGSIDASIVLAVEIDRDAEDSSSKFPDLDWDTTDFVSLDEELEDIHWVVRCLGFRYGWEDVTPTTQTQLRLAVVPYWSLVLLLTLIAARLILVPKQANRLDSNKTQSRPPETSTGP